MENTPPKFTEIHPALQHLTNEEILSLCNEYKEVKQKDLLEKYKLDIKGNITHKLPMLFIDEYCEVCNSQLIKHFAKKTDKLDFNKKVCANCNHTIYGQEYYSCHCIACEEKRLQEREAKRIALEKQREEELKPYKQYIEERIVEPYNMANMSLKNKVYLLYFLEFNTEMCFRTADKNIYYTLKVVSPTNSYLENIIQILFDEQILDFSDDINLSFVKRYIETNDIMQLALNGCLSINLEEFEKGNLLENVKAEIEQNSEVKRELWKELALQECVNYYTKEVDQLVNFHKNILNTEKILSGILEFYTVGQVYRVIIKGIEKLGHENWKIKSYEYSDSHFLDEQMKGFANHCFEKNFLLHPVNNYKAYIPSKMHKLLFEEILEGNANSFTDVLPQLELV